MADSFMLGVAALLLDDGQSAAFVDEVMASHGWAGVTADAARRWQIEHGYDCRCAACQPWRHRPIEVAAPPRQLSLF